MIQNFILKLIGGQLPGFIAGCIAMACAGLALSWGYRNFKKVTLVALVIIAGVALLKLLP